MFIFEVEHNNEVYPLFGLQMGPLNKTDCFEVYCKANDRIYSE